MAHQPILEAAELNEDDLARARQLVQEIEGSLRELADVTDRAHEGDTAAHARSVLFRSGSLAAEDRGGSVVVTYSDEQHHCIKVYEDPPGICRPCH